MERRLGNMSSPSAPSSARTAVPVESRPCAHLSVDELLDRLEWSYGETGAFEPEVVWEIARRAIEQA
jgi:hypothetical protein